MRCNECEKESLDIRCRTYRQIAKGIAEQTETFELLDDLSDGVSNKDEITEYSFAFAALTDMTERLKLTGILEDCGYTIATLISPKSYIIKTVKSGKGIMVESCAAVNCGAVINDCCYIGANATIDCESEVGRGSTICCGATVVDKYYVEPQTEVKHGQICYGNELA